MENDKRARILIVDDHPVMRRGLSLVLDNQSDMQVCAEADSMEQALIQFDESAPDLTIVDLSLGDGSGLELIKELRIRNPEALIVVSSMHDESLYAERVLRAGALAYVNKAEDTETLIAAIRKALAREIHVSPAMTSRLLQQMAARPKRDERSPVEKLSDRELEVFQLIGEGQLTKQIATRLGLSVKTIETYRENIKYKLGLSNAAELTRHAVQWVLEQA